MKVRLKDRSYFSNWMVWAVGDEYYITEHPQDADKWKSVPKSVVDLNKVIELDIKSMYDSKYKIFHFFGYKIPLEAIATESAKNIYYRYPEMFI